MMGFQSRRRVKHLSRKTACLAGTRFAKNNCLKLATRPFKLPGKVVIASLLAGLVLLLDAMAVCPALHELIHKDADTAAHQCVVTLFAHGQVDSATVEVSPVAQTVSIVAAPPIAFSIFAPAIGNLPAERAPPASVSSRV